MKNEYFNISIQNAQNNITEQFNIYSNNAKHYLFY